MKRSEFLVRIQTRIADATGIKLSKENLSQILDCIFDEVFNAVQETKMLKLRGFGCFYSRELKPREGYSIKAKQRIDLPAQTMFKFKPFDNIKKRINIPDLT